MLRRGFRPVKEGVGGLHVVAVQEELRDGAAGLTGHPSSEGDGALHAPPVAQVGGMEVLLCPSVWVEWKKRLAVHAAMMYLAPDGRCVNSHADHTAKLSCKPTVL